MIERGKDDFGRPYVSAGCDECDNALTDYYYIVDFDKSKMLCRDCAFELKHLKKASFVKINSTKKTQFLKRKKQNRVYVVCTFVKNLSTS